RKRKVKGKFPSYLSLFDKNTQTFHATYHWQIPCGNYYCHDGFYCYSGNCRPIRSCGAHDHCPSDQYCDIHLRVCRKGIRRCYAHHECGYGNICKGGICKKRECRKHTDCPDNEACYYPGICRGYQAYCHEGYPGYCKDGYVCVAKRCKKRQCNSKYDCKLGDHCVGGFCKPQPGFCSSDGDCDKNQCCAKGNDQHGVCKS
ncbi:unnamed protein product, partial [Pocillopora meandrina]